MNFTHGEDHNRVINITKCSFNLIRASWNIMPVIPRTRSNALSGADWNARHASTLRYANYGQMFTTMQGGVALFTL